MKDAIALLSRIAVEGMTQYKPEDLDPHQLGQLNGLVWAIGLLLDPPAADGVLDGGVYMELGYRYLGRLAA